METVNDYINVTYYTDMGHLMYSPIDIPSELTRKMLDEHIEEYFITDKNFTTRHYASKTSIKIIRVEVNGNNYLCRLDF